MNIGQLEAALGMTRANIRFYEKEGLLSPTRSENGYRDYTGSDLDTLRRIKLLRQLQFSLEDIRAMQTGALDLPAALRQQEARLQRRANDLDAARALCRTMEADGVQYRDLNAGKYLEEMVRLEQGGVRFQSVERDALPTVNHPWRRFFARSLDFSLCRLLLDAVLALGGGAGSAQGTGGMATKLSAARLATRHGVEMVIANGKKPEILYDILEGKPVGTRFSAQKGARA